ncbi:keratin-associated protein 10-9 [Gastrophryne carolinensis]
MPFFLLGIGTFMIIHLAKAFPDLPDTENCQSDMEYTCRRTCFGNCDQLNSTTEACTLQCNWGCECKNSSYVRLSSTADICVKPSSCKVTCPENMHFESCFSGSEPACKTEEMPSSPPQCIPRCVCNNGYVRHYTKSGRSCIKPSDCPQ